LTAIAKRRKQQLHIENYTILKGQKNEILTRQENQTPDCYQEQSVIFTLLPGVYHDPQSWRFTKIKRAMFSEYSNKSLTLAS